MGSGFFGRRRRRGGSFAGGIAGLAAGAGLIYFLEPRGGAGRRSQVAQRAGRVLREVEETVEAGARDLQHRARGLAHEARARVSRENVPDEVLAERVRARLGRLTAHPGAIRVAARAGAIELSGPIFRAEQAQVLRGVRLVRGVHGVEDRLEPHDTAEGVPALQGAGPQPGPRPEPLQEQWAPGMKLAAACLGAGLLGKALLGRGFLRIPSGIVGAALIGTVMRRSEAARREARRLARAASEASARVRERRAEGEAHRGAWHPEPDVKEGKSPAELASGNASGSSQPTAATRVDPRQARGGGGGGRQASAGDDPDRQATGDVIPPAGYLAPSEGASVRVDDLGAVLPLEPEEDEARREGGGAAPGEGGAPRNDPA